jgi:hypothetical protein
MKLGCWRAGHLLDSRAAQPSAAHGLLLEEHLASCASCRARANLLAGLRALSADSVHRLSGPERAQVLQAALSMPRTAAAQSAPPSRSAWFAVPAVAAVAALWLIVARHGPAAPAITTARSDRLVAGQLECAGSELRAGEALPPHTRLESSGGARVTLAHARVELRPGTSVDWDPRSHQLRLNGGSVFVDVDASKHERFSVRAERFSVEVLGTRFEVTATNVHVWRGVVRVVDSAGIEQARLDTAQPFWQTQPLAADGGGAGRPAAIDDAGGAAPRLGDVATRTSGRAAGPGREASAPLPRKPIQNHPAADGGGGTQTLLSEARQQLGAGHTAAAGRLLDRALSRSLSPELHAEALSLRAECALVAHEYAQAREAYLAVAAQWPALAAGKTALFAAGRIEAQHGRPERAQQLLEQYLAVDPRGAFAHEAKARLQALERKLTQ